MLTQGILYIATNKKKYINFANISAKSVRKVWPEISITICTNMGKYAHRNLFDRILDPPELSNKPFRDWVAALKPSLYDKTVVLDADTYVCYPFQEIFDALDKIDLMATLSMGQRFYGNRIPKGFYELSTGVVAIKKSANIDKFLDDWYSEFSNPERKTNNDQESFRSALYHSENIKFAPLPNEYNFKPRLPMTYRGLVKIIHTNYYKKLDYEKLGKLLNQLPNKTNKTNKTNKSKLTFTPRHQMTYRGSVKIIYTNYYEKLGKLLNQRRRRGAKQLPNKSKLTFKHYIPPYYVEVV